MKILQSPSEARTWRGGISAPLGLVPTMGFLHEGHLALVRRARAENGSVAASIFVNPTQFGPAEDFARYPRDEARDLDLLEGEGVDAVYMPAPEVVYPAGFQTYVTVEELSQPLEGAARPGHFRGVATVVLKLLNTLSPDRAYFGRKDAQQLRVIQRMVRDLDLSMSIVPCDIVREPDGLAMSSRNVYLSPADRAAAPVIYRGLCAARALYGQGTRDADTLRQCARAAITAEPLATLEYLSLADDLTLQEVQGTLSGPALLSVVVRFGATRLIDNVELGE